MEFNPEFFGSITMLYIEISINGHPIQVTQKQQAKRGDYLRVGWKLVLGREWVLRIVTRTDAGTRLKGERERYLAEREDYLYSQRL